MQASELVEITRPSDTTPYSIGDVVTRASALPMEFGNMVWFKNNGGKIRTISLQKSTATIANAAFRLYLYGATVASIGADNAAAVLRYTDAPKFIGYVDLPTMVVDGSSVMASTQMDLDKAFACTSGSRSIFVFIVALAAYVPGSAEKFSVRLTVDRES